MQFRSAPIRHLRTTVGTSRRLQSARAYRRDLPDAPIHLLGGGHWLLETHLDEVLPLVDGFLTTSTRRACREGDESHGWRRTRTFAETKTKKRSRCSASVDA